MTTARAKQIVPMTYITPAVVAWAQLWIRFCLWWLRVTVGLDHRLHGLENLPAGPVIVASKHQSSWETLAYTLLSYFAITIHRRVLWFSPTMQADHILPLLLAAQAVTVIIRVAFGAGFPGLWIFLESFMTAALWPLLQFILLAPQKLPMNRDEDRPI